MVKTAVEGIWFPAPYLEQSFSTPVVLNTH